MSSVRTPSVAVFLALLVLATGCSRTPSDRETKTWSAEIQRLQAEQDSLRQVAAALVARDPRIQSLPKGDVVIAVPTAFVRSVVEHLIADVASNVSLRLSGIRAHVEKPVKKIVTIGKFVVDVEITEVTGKLKPGQPAIAFGGNRVTLSLPVEVVEGHGAATIHFVWDGKNVADLACGDMDLTQAVSGDVIPAAYSLSGRLTFANQGTHLLGRLRFPETRVRIRVKPSKESWQAVHAILDEKRGVCGWVLDKVDVPKILTNLVQEKGFNVKLPLDKIKPFRVPAGVSESVKVGDKTLALDVQTNTIRIDPDAIWYSASVGIK